MCSAARWITVVSFLGLRDVGISCLIGLSLESGGSVEMLVAQSDSLAQFQSSLSTLPLPTLTPFVRRVSHIKCHSKPISLKWVSVIKPSNMSLHRSRLTTTLLSSAAPIFLYPGWRKRHIPTNVSSVWLEVISCLTSNRFLIDYFCAHRTELEVTMYFGKIVNKKRNLRPGFVTTSRTKPLHSMGGPRIR